MCRAQHAQVIDHQRHQSPCRPKITHTCHIAYKGAGNDRVKGVNALIAVGQQVAEPVAAGPISRKVNGTVIAVHSSGVMKCAARCGSPG